MQFMNVITHYFPLWALLASVFAYFAHSYLLDAKFLIIPLLMAILFFMGLGLRFEDFIRVLRQPKVIALALILQYSIMPVLAFGLANFFSLSPDLIIGMVLLGCTAGGTASNVICYLAKADVALSISMTFVSTVVAAFLMPALVWLFIHQTVPVPAQDMLFNLIKIVLLPLLIGITINQFFRQQIQRLQAIFPMLASLAIIIIIAIIVALNHANIQQLSLGLFAAVVLHNLLGLIIAYFIVGMYHYDKTIRRTVAIEVAMQNSGLSVALAIKYFTPLAALPGAIFSIWHNISGMSLAAYWARKTEHEHTRKL
ncbi:MAG: bile acid:sodium symporter family protein [Gammaproteobacteria bacterium]|nr:bile acid:sodium symporter family protein [Gammaproteobacteria bacterium]